MSLVVFTAFVGLLVAPGSVNPVIAFCAVLVIALGGGASGALNMWYVADNDAVMHRTRKRPVPSGRVARQDALAVLAVESNLVAVAAANVAHGVALSQLDLSRVLQAAGRIQKIVEVFA